MCDGGDGGDGDGDTGMEGEDAGMAAAPGPVGPGGGGTGPGSISAAISAGVAAVANAAGASSGQSNGESNSSGNLLDATTLEPVDPAPVPTSLPAPPPTSTEVDIETGEVTVVEVAHASVTQGQVDAATAALSDPASVAAGYVTSDGFITIAGTIAMQEPIGSNPVAQGSQSVVGGLGAGSEVAQAAAAANPNNPGASSGVSLSDIVALSLEAIDPSTGLMTSVLNIPNPPMGTTFDQASRSSFIAGALNPDLSAVISTISMAMMPMPMAMLAGSLQAAQADEMGLPPPGGLFSALTSALDEDEPVNTGIPALDSVVNTASTAVTNVTDFISEQANAAQIAVGYGIGGLIENVLGTVDTALDATLGQGLEAIDTAITNVGVNLDLFDVVDPGVAASTEAVAGMDFAGAGDIGDLGGGEVDELPTPAPVVEEPRRDTRPDATVISNVETFLDTSATTSLVSIPDVATPILGVDEDLGVAPMFSTLPRMGSFRRSRVTSAKDRAFGAASLFRPTLSAGISL